MTGFRTVVVDDEDTTIILTPAGKWSIDEWSDEFTAEQGSYSWSDAPRAQISFTFPMAATSVSYFGQHQPECCIGLYELCVDCDPLDLTANWRTIDAFVNGGVEDDAPILLYSQSFDTPGVHTVIIRGGGSEITIDRMELQVPDSSRFSSSTTTAASSNSTAIASSTATITTTIFLSNSPLTSTVSPSSAFTPPLSTLSSPGPLVGSSAASTSQELTTTLSTSHHSLPSSPHPASTITPPTASASVTAKPHSTNSKLSAAAIAGISIGSFVAIVGLILLLLRLHRGQKSSYKTLITPFTPNLSITSLRGALSSRMERPTTGIHTPSETSLWLSPGVPAAQSVHPGETNRNYHNMDIESNRHITASNVDRYSTTDSMNSHNMLQLAYA